MSYITKKEFEDKIVILDGYDNYLKKRINLVRNTLTPRIDLLESNSSNNVTISDDQTINGNKIFNVSPRVPDISVSDTATANDNKAINKLYCDSKINNLVNSAPGALDTLKELATALNNDANFATTVTNSLATKGTLTSSNTWTNANRIYELRINKIIESYSSPSNSNSINIAYSTTAGSTNMYVLSPTTINDMSLTITGLPTIVTSFISFTFVINTSTYATFIKTLTISGNSIPLYFNGGLVNIDITSTQYVIQNINININNTSTPIYAFSSVSGFS